MPSTDDRLDRIEQLLHTVLERLPRRRRSGVNAEGELSLNDNEVHQQRVAEIERIFVAIVNDHENKRMERYKIPQYLRGHPLKPFTEAVTVSVLCNQASLRKIFRTRAAGDPSDSTPSSRAQTALDASNLVQVSAVDTHFETTVSTKLALSPAECIISVPKVLWPEEFRGWTCTERVQSRVSPADDSVIRPLEDPSGRRDWDMAEEESEPEPEPKKVRKLKLGK